MKNNNNLFMPALTLGALLLPLASGLFDVRILFLVFFAAVFIARYFLGHQEFTSECADVVFYAASFVQLCYLINTAVFNGIFPFFDSLSNQKSFADMLALWVIPEAVLRYIYSDDRKRDAAYITVGIIAELTLAVNGQWGAQFLMLAMIVGIAVTIMPLAEQMRRVLQLFFGAAFIMCNMSLLFNYTEWLQVEDVTYSLETSVVCELVLSVLALYVLHEWDKIPKDTDITRVRLCTLQNRIKKLCRISLAVIVIIGFIGYDMGIGASGTKISFLGENGEAAQTGIFTNTAVSLLYQVYGAVQAAFSQNIIGTGFALAGLIGAVIAIIFMGICIWLMYRGYCQSFEGKEHFAVIALTELLQLLLIPSAWELFPMYILFLYGALREYMPDMETIKNFIRRHKIRKEYEM
ncbi:MAG: hypothetical protein J6D08_16540 [Lachnospiraceae bacterium]|nr:hypothetical protein [Lachnospiraceae bacterium]